MSAIEIFAIFALAAYNVHYIKQVLENKRMI